MTSTGDSFVDLMRAAWKGRSFVFAGMICGVLVAIFLMFTLTPRYEAHMIIAPPAQGNEEKSLTVLNGNPQAFPQMSVSNQIPRDYTKFQQSFREVSVARIFSKYQGILDNVNKDTIFRFMPGPDVKTPEELSAYIKNHVVIEPVGATSSFMITFRHPDAQFTEKFLGHLHKITDEMIRNEARVQSENRIAYLQKALQEAYNPDHRKALADLLLLEERQKMLIAMDQPYAAELVEPPSASPKPVWPRGSVIVPFCLLIGAFFGFLMFSFKNADTE